MRELKTGDKEIEIYRETNWKWMGDMKRETKAGREMGIGEHRLPTEARGGQGRPGHSESHPLGLDPELPASPRGLKEVPAPQEGPSSCQEGAGNCGRVGSARRSIN